MASVVDYSKFEKLGLEEEQEEIAARKADRERRLEQIRKQNGGVLPAKYVDSDGETVSDDEEDAAERRKQFDEMGKLPAVANADAGGDSDSDSDDEEDLHPLFWTKMPKEGGKGSEYAKVFKDLVYKNDDDEEKSPNQLAQEFKEKGNEFFKWGVKFHKRALKEYKEALAWARKGDGSDENRACYAAILSNRAAINLKARNFGSVVRDCEAAIDFGPDPLPNSKTHFRAAQASFELGKPRQALKFLKGALKLDPENKVILELKDKIGRQLVERQRAQLARERAQAQELKLDEDLRKVCNALSIKVGPLVSDIQMYIQKTVGNRTAGGFPRPGMENGSMQWAVLFMFPEKMQTDFIQAMDLSHSFLDHFQMMFPRSRAECPSELVAPWDEDFDYTLDALEVYFEEREVESFDMSKMWASQYGKRPDKVDYSKRMRVKVALDKPLYEALRDPSYVVPGVPTFYVVSNRTKYYKETFCPQHEGRLRIL